MSFLKISDPVKRDLIVQEFLELKKNIRDNFLSGRTGEQQLQPDLSKFYRPITETQKATTREITEGLKPIKEGIEKLLQALGKEEEEDEELYVGRRAELYLKDPDRDRTFGIRKEEGIRKIGNKEVEIFNNNIKIEDEIFEGTIGLWELLTSKNPEGFDEDDYKNHVRLMLKTNALHRKNDPNNTYPKSSKSGKWKLLLKPIWERYKKKEGYEEDYEEEEEYEGKGVVVIPSNPNALLERQDLLLASQKAGHTGVRNELVSICEELKRQGVLNSMSYKKLNSVFKK